MCPSAVAGNKKWVVVRFLWGGMRSIPCKQMMGWPRVHLLVILQEVVGSEAVRRGRSLLYVKYSFVHGTKWLPPYPACC